MKTETDKKAKSTTQRTQNHPQKAKKQLCAALYTVCVPFKCPQNKTEQYTHTQQCK